MLYFDCLTGIKTKHKPRGVPMHTFVCLIKIKTKHKSHGVLKWYYHLMEYPCLLLLCNDCGECLGTFQIEINKNLYCYSFANIVFSRNKYQIKYYRVKLVINPMICKDLEFFDTHYAFSRSAYLVTPHDLVTVF